MANRPTRKTNRLREYDYSRNGAYFITICVKDMKRLLSSVVGADIIRPQGNMSADAFVKQPSVVLTCYGRTVKKAILSIEDVYENVFVDNYVIMPNHIHMLLRIENNHGRMVSAPTVIGSLKRYVSKELGVSIWQKGFYDHIVRDEYDFMAKWQYIDENPRKWIIGKDKYYSQ